MDKELDWLYPATEARDATNTLKSKLAEPSVLTLMRKTTPIWSSGVQPATRVEQSIRQNNAAWQSNRTAM